MTRLALLAAVGLLLACAQPRQPTGGPPVVDPPRVVAVSPAPYSVLTDLGRPVVIRFDDRLSERLEGVRSLEEAVLVSPETGEVRVRRGRRELRVSVAGGWQPGLVYRVVVLPVLRDLFGNVRAEAVELVFSTGAPIPETAVAGFVEDRLTGRVVANARVHATHRDDARTYMAVTDTAGFFSLRHVPEGSYDVVAWLDQNRNRAVNYAEPQDSGFFTLAVRDTVILEMGLLPGDTTPARLTRAEPIDSTKVRLSFDDYFEPGPVEGRARVYRAEDSTFVAFGELLHATRLDSLLAAERAAAEAAADTAPAVDIPRPPADSPAVDAPRPPADGRAVREGIERRPGARQAPEASPLPARELVLVLPAPLAVETAYYVVVEDLVNIRGIPGGGGTATFRTLAARAPEPEPDPEPPEPDGEPPPPPPDSLSDG
jgi:hypothetical protein